MLVEIDKGSGFCFGVQNAVEIAEKALLKGEKVFSLGPIVHNDVEVERLSEMGMISIDHNEFKNLKNSKVLIRAHGEPPETYLTAARNNLTIIEATCPIVKKLQSRIKKTWMLTREIDGQVVIFGKPGHAEVTGLLGQTSNKGILVSGPEDLAKVDFTKEIWLFSQTTMSTGAYKKLIALMRSEMKKRGITDTEKTLHVNNTICRQVSNREPSLINFARKHDIVIFVSGKESSNGKMLYSVCRNINPETYFISSPDEIQKSWFKGKKSAGISGATSTPKWLIEKAYEVISTF
ncbi:MAG: 4-hydroxy-3-methylbut-2-enyl diphosphate reductase [Bacteroidales bacterium]|nr:4-hydroxy-3-methylbut-2-enyl diphosphate reductase [Bacteroidales bacterium]